MMHMTIADLASEYAPYNEMPAFHLGVRDYQTGAVRSTELGGHGQAYDRGAECAGALR
jgi:hypothetical protein